MSIREAIRRQRKPLPIEAGEPWGTLYLRVMTGAERDAFNRIWKQLAESKSDENAKFNAELLVRTLCDENGKREYKDDEVDQLVDLDSKLSEQLWSKALDLNRISVDSQADLKNSSGQTTNAASGLPSQAS